MNKSPIEWTNWTSNPIQAYAPDEWDGEMQRGWFCEKVSPGCAHCYSSTLNERRGRGNGLAFLPANREKVTFRLNESELAEWSRKKRDGTPAYSGRCFAFDMTDLFGEWVSDDWLFTIFAAMAGAPNMEFQILTKRPERAHDFITSQTGRGWPLSNVWLGVTVENQRWADYRIPILLDTPAAVHFVSAEPLLGMVTMPPAWFRNEEMLRPVGLDWVIIGGESGSKHRPFDPKWAQILVDQCAIWGVAAFVKQLGGARPGNRLDDLPEDLRVRQFPS